MFCLLSHYYFTRIYEFLLTTQVPINNISNGVDSKLLQSYFPLILLILVIIILGILLFVKKTKDNYKNNTNLQQAEKKSDIHQNDRENERESIYKGNKNINGADEGNKNLIDDKELVAIITAAILAYEGNEQSPDELIIRSIRKVNKRKYINEYNTY